MAAIHESYTREMYDEYGLFASWLPNTRVALGDVGELRDRRFDRMTSLRDMGIRFTTRPPSVPGDLTYTSAGSVDVRLTGDAGTGDQDLMSVSITFARAGATFFQASDCVWTEIADRSAIERDLLAHPDWRPSYVVVTKLLRTGPAVVLVSREDKARVDLRVNVSLLTGSAPIARATGGLAIASTSSLAVRSEMPDGATPLFDAMCVRRSLLGRRRLRWRSTGGAPPMAPDIPGLASLTWDDYAARG